MKSSTVNIGDAGTAAQYDNLRADAFGGSELLAHAQSSPNMTLKVELGVCYIGATRVIFAGGNSPTFTAPTTHPRIDLLTIDSSGALATVTGTEAASPSTPAYPANKAVLCEIFHRVGETSIKDADDTTNGYIQNDVRPIVAPVYISSTSQFGTSVVPDSALASTFIHDPGSDAQGDIIYFNGAAWARLPAGTSGQLLKTGGPSANPSWSSALIGEIDGTVANQTFTATTTLQSDDVVVTHNLGRTPAFITISCLIQAPSNPTFNALSQQGIVTFNSSGSPINGLTASFYPNTSGSYSPSVLFFGSQFFVSSIGGTQGVTITVGVTSVTTTQFTLHITYQMTTGTGSFICGNGVANINWSVVG